jgi:hypothetical protein
MEEMKDILWGLGQVIGAIGLACIPISIYLGLKHKAEVKKLEEQKRLKELELESQRNQLRLLEEESRKYDRFIRRAEDTRL